MRTNVLVNWLSGNHWLQLIAYENPRCSTGKDTCYVVHNRETGEVPYRGRSRGNAEGVFYALQARLQG